MVVSQVMKTAKDLNLKGLMAYSSDDSTLKRSEKHGFVKIPQTLIIANLTSKA
jgi:hypothetical protein